MGTRCLSQRAIAHLPSTRTLLRVSVELRLYAQALAKIERGHARDVADVRAMLARELITRPRLHELLVTIQPELIRYPAIDPASFGSAVIALIEAGGEN